MSNVSSSFEYENVVIFANLYQSIHAYIAIPICVVGVLVNVINVIVLSRKELRSATNLFLLHIAICHIILNAAYVTHLSFQYFIVSERCDPRRDSRVWLTFTLAFAHTTLTTHGLSTWLTVGLAAVRCLQLRTKNVLYSEPVVALKAMVVTAVGVVFICIPSFVCFNVISTTDPNEPDCDYEENQTHFRVGPSQFSEYFDGLPLNFVFWFTSFSFFLVPAVLLSVFITYLISTVTSFGKRRIKLGLAGTTTGCWHIQHHTSMLLAILIIFLSTQLPQGILTLLGSFLSESYRLEVYQNLGELMELLSLINGSVSFPLYCSMSSQFRNTFRRLFCPSRRTATVIDAQQQQHEENTNTYAYEQGVVMSAPCEKCSGSKDLAHECHPLVATVSANQSVVSCNGQTTIYSSFVVHLHQKLSLLDSEEV